MLKARLLKSVGILFTACLQVIACTPHQKQVSTTTNQYDNKDVERTYSTQESQEAPHTDYAQTQEERVKKQDTAPMLEDRSLEMEVKTILNFVEDDVELSNEDINKLESVAKDLANETGLIAKIESYGHTNNGNSADARRQALQRALKARRFLIENGVSPGNISINAFEDVNTLDNRIEILLEAPAGVSLNPDL